MCGFCDIENRRKLKGLNLFSELEIDTIIEKIFSGLIDLRNLDVETYLKVARKLSEGMVEGFGKSLFDVQWGSPDYEMIKALRENIYIFSGAKQYQQVRAMSDLLTGEGKINSFYEFKKKAKEIFTTYNEHHLAAEYNSAISQARSASQWQTIEAEKDVLPMLIYKTAEDARVRITHASMDNIARPVVDKFWDNYFPPNGWNCRCTVDQSESKDKTDMRTFRHPTDVPDIFMMNAGKDRIIFSPKHPYFDVAPKDKAFAKQNFNLPMP